MGENFNIWLNDEELKKLVEEFGTTDKAEFQKLLKQKVINQTYNQTPNLDDSIKLARLNNLNLDALLKEKKLYYANTFDSLPSPQAEKAMQKGIEQRELTNQEFENVKKYITVRKDTFNQSKWIGKCDICKEGETYETYKEMIDDLIRHLTTEHTKKVMETR